MPNTVGPLMMSQANLPHSLLLLSQLARERGNFRDFKIHRKLMKIAITITFCNGDQKNEEIYVSVHVVAL